MLKREDTLALLQKCYYLIGRGYEPVSLVSGSCFLTEKWKAAIVPYSRLFPAAVRQLGLGGAEI